MWRWYLEQKFLGHFIVTILFYDFSCDICHNILLPAYIHLFYGLLYAFAFSLMAFLFMFSIFHWLSCFGLYGTFQSYSWFSPWSQLQCCIAISFALVELIFLHLFNCSQFTFNFSIFSKFFFLFVIGSSLDHLPQYHTCCPRCLVTHSRNQRLSA